MFAKGNMLLAVCSFCLWSVAATSLLHSKMSLFDSEVQVTFSKMELKTSHFRRKKARRRLTVTQTWLILPPLVSLQSPVALPYHQRGNEQVGLASSSAVRSEAYHAIPLLTLRLTTQVLSESWISDISNTKYLQAIPRYSLDASMHLNTHPKHTFVILTTEQHPYCIPLHPDRPTATGLQLWITRDAHDLGMAALGW